MRVASCNPSVELISELNDVVLIEVGKTREGVFIKLALSAFHDALGHWIVDLVRPLAIVKLNTNKDARDSSIAKPFVFAHIDWSPDPGLTAEGFQELDAGEIFSPVPFWRETIWVGVVWCLILEVGAYSAARPQNSFGSLAVMSMALTMPETVRMAGSGRPLPHFS